MKKQELLDNFDEELMDKLFGFCYARTNDSYEAQELCSDIMYALVKSARTVGEITNLHPFIWRVARNVYYDFLKDKKRRQEVFYEGGLEDGLAVVSNREQDESRELLEAVYRQIAFLTKMYREVMIMFYIDGLSTAEIAKKSGISETTVRQRLFWARHKVECEVRNVKKAMDRPLSLDKMDFYIWGNGDPGWGDPRDVGLRTLSRHIIWLCRKKPMCAAEIAEKLNVPTIYIEEELEVLANGKNGEYGLLKREGNDRYIINFVLLDENTMKKAMQIYAEQMPKVCRIIADHLEKHRAEYLEFPYLNHCFVNGEPDFNLVLWQQMYVIAGAFRKNVGRILGETYFSDHKKPERPFSVLGHVVFDVSYSAGVEETHAENLCGFRRVRMTNLNLSHIERHFIARHNISTDPQLLMALRAIDGLEIASLTDQEKEHAAKAVESGFLYREGDRLYTKILVCPMEEDDRLFEVSKRLCKGCFEKEARETADKLAVLIKKTVPKHLLGEWEFANTLAGMQSVNLVENTLIEQGILTPPRDGIGAEGCWMSVCKQEGNEGKMNIELVRLTSEYREQLFEMLTEWKNDIIVNHTNRSPWKIWSHDFHDFDNYLENLDTKEETKDGRVPDTTLFCLDKDRNIFVGAVNIRHYLNEELLRTGGHIGDGIRPSERRKGYGTAMIALALEECKKLGIHKVLMCCDKNNIGSAKSIIRNGGVLENEVEEDGNIEQRYWIQL